jgi:ferredoxin
VKVRVDEDLCIGCGICEGIAPEVFSLENGPVAEVIMDPVEADFQDAAREAAEECPETAIIIEEDADEQPYEETALEQPCQETTTEVLDSIELETEVEESNPIMVSERKEEMRTTVDPDLCIGCGICEGIVPEVFSLLNEPYAEVLLDPVPEEYQDAVREAAEECPEEAITVIE